MLSNGELCRCNNCGGLFNDTNPQTDAPRFDNTETLPELELLEEVDNDIKAFFHGCPVCKTDENLSDVTGLEDLTIEERKIYTLAIAA